MGCAISCNLSEDFSSFLHWDCRYKLELVHFFSLFGCFPFGGFVGSDDCACLMHDFHRMCDPIRVPIAQDKTMGPSIKIIYIYILFEIDKIAIVVRTLQEKCPAIKCIANSNID